ncbi:unnamed protein product [Clonostachys rosea]|uniref:Uncharacterized protein n=1 Tax=Bionectria ochroleuca TaxID=29856 RepID=A0ABY6U4M7_BIOOC|nr:unnamed protein product [Clonostachys rosea]
MPFSHPSFLSALPLAFVIASLILIVPISVITELSPSPTRLEDYFGQDLVVRTQPRIPGIGISLNYDYVAAAIYFENGTSVPVAHIDGDVVYRSFMRATYTECDSSPRYYSSQPYTRLEESESLARMLLQLKASIVSRLDGPFCFLVASRPDYKCNTASDPDGRWNAHQTEVLNSALGKVGLYLGEDRMIHAGFASAFANHMMSGNEEENGYVLSIDRGHYGWRYTLLYIDQGYGASHGGITFVHDAEERGPLRDKARDDLRKVLDYDPDFTLDEFKDVIISGDLASDADFQEDLASVLGSEMVAKARDRDPIYTSALGAAFSSFYNVNSQLFDPRPGFHCCKKYNGHGCPAHNQAFWEDKRDY